MGFRKEVMSYGTAGKETAEVSTKEEN